jgi:hypothetical protein
MDLGVLPPLLTTRWDEQDGFELVTTLRLSGNDLIDVFFGLSHWGSISTLDLDSNKIATLPREIYMLRAVTQLLLSRNLLVELPQSFGLLTTLNVLALDTNRFRTFPPAVLPLHSLEKLRQVLLLLQRHHLLLPRVPHLFVRPAPGLRNCSGSPKADFRRVWISSAPPLHDARVRHPVRSLVLCAQLP